MIRRVFFIIIISSLSVVSLASVKGTPMRDGDLFEAFIRLRAAPNLEVKIAINDSIREMFRDVLQYNDSYTHAFDTLKTVGKLMSPDKAFRIINWNITHPDGSYSYYGFIQYYIERKDTIKLTELIDFSERMVDPEQQMVSADQWYGALYYEIVPMVDKKRTHYLLLGWDGGDLFLNRKVIEVLSFTSSGTPKFGKNVFIFKKERKKRVLFDFSYMATMRLFYDDEIDMVVFEHMVPINSNQKDNRSTYGSDLTFDGLHFKDGKWRLEENLNVKNKKKHLNKRKKDISYTF